MPEVPAVPRASELTAAVARVLRAPEARWRGRCRGSSRGQAQIEMASAVAAIFAEGGTLLAEAGTGTGKTLAYLVPAIMQPAARPRLDRHEEPSGTDLLQGPSGPARLARRALHGHVHEGPWQLSVPAPLRCVARLGCRQEPASSSRGPPAAPSTSRQSTSGPAQTETGDRAEIEDLPEDLPFWNDIAATTENCIGTECPRYQDCFVVRMRQRAAESDVVIVNHHLLCADAAVRQSAFGEVIPNCRFAIVDEAHQLEDVATQYFGLSISNYRLDDFARDVSAHPRNAGRPDRARTRSPTTRIGSRARRATFFAAAQMLRHEMPGVGIGVSDNRMRLRSGQTARLADEGAALTVGARGARSGHRATRRTSRRTCSPLRAAPRRSATKSGSSCARTTRGSSTTSRCAARGVFLRAAPIDVSSIVQRHAVRAAAGRGPDVGDADRRWLVRVPARTPRAEDAQPRSGSTRSSTIAASRSCTCRATCRTRARRDFVSAAAGEVIEILKRTRGRAFVLFTSYANLREVHRVLSAELEYPIFVQGTAPRSALLRDFKATPNAVLLATSSFWQGVDVVGEALSCVIIDKLPFASPGDPDHRRPDRGHRGARRFRFRRIPGAARHPRA